MSAAWGSVLFSVAAKLIAAARSSGGREVSPGWRMAQANLAKHALDLIRAHELSDIADAAEDHERSKMQLERENLRAEIDLKKAQAVKTIAEAGEIGNRARLADVQTAREELELVKDKLSILRQYGGAVQMNGKQVRIVASVAGEVTGTLNLPLPLMSGPTNEAQVATPGAASNVEVVSDVRVDDNIAVEGSGSVVGHAPEVVIKPAAGASTSQSIAHAESGTLNTATLDVHPINVSTHVDAVVLTTEPKEPEPPKD